MRICWGASNISVEHMKSKYRIINVIDIEGDHLLWPEWESFRYSENGKPDLSVSVCSISEYRYGLEIIPTQPGPPVLKCEDALLCVNSTWDHAKITLLENGSAGLPGLLSGLLLTHLSTRGGMLFHASLVETEEGGILFTGPSGIGKTTQAELWQKYRNGTIINGDMVFIHCRDGKYYGCGSPWHGSSPYCENRQVEIKGIVVLKKRMENEIRPLYGGKLLQSMMDAVFLPGWYPEGAAAVCDNLAGFLAHTPVYELGCRPDMEAVALLERTLFPSAAGQR